MGVMQKEQYDMCQDPESGENSFQGTLSLVWFWVVGGAGGHKEKGIRAI